jgi:hypothetical protein
MNYTFHLWHIPVALGAVFIVWVVCSMYQAAKRDIAARKAWAQYVRLHPDEEE